VQDLCTQLSTLQVNFAHNGVLKNLKIIRCNNWSNCFHCGISGKI